MLIVNGNNEIEGDNEVPKELVPPDLLVGPFGVFLEETPKNLSKEAAIRKKEEAERERRFRKGPFSEWAKKEEEDGGPESTESGTK